MIASCLYIEIKDKDSTPSFEPFIDATIKAVNNTGVLVDASGTDLGRGRGKPKGHLRRSEWRTKMDEVEARLNRIHTMIPTEAVAPDSDLAAVMDNERDEIIRILNSLWEETRLPALPIPTEAPTYNDVVNL